jgi:hypothetical protein
VSARFYLLPDGKPRPKDFKFANERPERDDEPVAAESVADPPRPQLTLLVRWGCTMRFIDAM